MPPKKIATAGTEERVIEIRRLQQAVIHVPIRGISPVIPHKWSEKAGRMMRERQQGSKTAVRAAREAKDPEEDGWGCLYLMPGQREKDPHPRVGLRAEAFKAAMVGACRLVEGLTMTQAKLLFYVEGEQVGPYQLAEFEYGEMTLREDFVRNQTGVADIRYRYQFFPWSCTLSVRYLKDKISPESVLALVDAAGKVGVADWRPGSPQSATGTYGMFVVDDNAFAEARAA